MEIKHRILCGIVLGTIIILWFAEYLSLGVITVFVAYLFTFAANKYPTTPRRSDDEKYSAKLQGIENKTIAEDATLKLRVIFESLEKMLNMEEFEKDLQAELSAVYPDYMTVLQTAKDDLLRKDCSIVLTGETSAGKSTLLNTLVGRKIFPVSNVAATGKVCRVRNSDTLYVKTYDRHENLINEEIATSEQHLTEVIIRYSDTSRTSAETGNVFYVDVHMPVEFLKGNIIIVDTPGIGETDELDQMLIDFLPSAVSMIFVVNANSAGGIQKGRLMKIFKEVLQNLDKMPCFDPKEVIFLTNKWDIIEKEDSVGVNEHEKTWKTIIGKLKNEWTFMNEENVFKVSLKQGKSGARIFANELQRFEDLLHETIQRNQNKRIKHHFSFLEDFTQNAERGTLARLQLVRTSNTKQQEILLTNTGRMKILQDILQTRRFQFEKDKTDKTTELAMKLYKYLHSEGTKEQILNPTHDTAIASVGIRSLRGKINARFENAIQVWLDGDEMKKIVSDVDENIKNLLREVESKLNEIETEMIGLKTPLRSNDICDNFMSESVTIFSGVSGISFMESLISVYFRIAFGFVFSLKTVENEQMADKLFRTVLQSLSLDKIRTCFEKSFSMEYEKKIRKIFDTKLKQKVDSLSKTNQQLDIQQEAIRQKQHAYEILQELIQKIERESDEFIATIKQEENK